jgi:hypothetical protein
MAKLNNKKWKISSFYEEKSLVGLTLGGLVLYFVTGTADFKSLQSVRLLGLFCYCPKNYSPQILSKVT